NNTIAQQIKIGSQTWATKNLNVSNFRNGEAIPQAKTKEEWQKAGMEGKPAWCYYANDPANGTKYGKLYNWYAVNDPRGLAPKGWRIPSDEEWTTLIEFLGGEVEAGLKIKSDYGWKNNKNGLNTSGFTGLPSGYRDENSTFNNIGAQSHWWSSSKEYNGIASCYFLAYVWANLNKSISKMECGLSVRCLSGSTTQQTASKTDGISIKLQAKKIGTQTWATKNLDVSTFRNGEAIPEAITDAEWEEAGKQGKPVWCYYGKDPANGKKYGKLYNWYAVNDPRGLAPKGWHIPSDEEWTTLTDNLGGEERAGTQMKSGSGWEDNGNGSNSSGFEGLPGGLRFYFGEFRGIGYFGQWWSSSEGVDAIGSGGRAWCRDLNNTDGVKRDLFFVKETGLSVRCLRD
ncbi:MAG TPA: fibrobacter succinogenes major paralogous domain-containing protein, partial [Chitinophagaceae bacterium]|nr:fibrobacter succinogenes major paralogous domain-containing protein [Chitinophagaceae bacterium]